MLKGIDPASNADIPRARRAMGDGDDPIIADTDVSSDPVARQTGERRFHGCIALRAGVIGPEA